MPDSCSKSVPKKFRPHDRRRARGAGASRHTCCNVSGWAMRPQCSPIPRRDGWRCWFLASRPRSPMFATVTGPSLKSLTRMERPLPPLRPSRARSTCLSCAGKNYYFQGRIPRRNRAEERPAGDGDSCRSAAQGNAGIYWPRACTGAASGRAFRASGALAGHAA